MKRCNAWQAFTALTATQAAVMSGRGVPGIVTATFPDSIGNAERLKRARSLSRWLAAAGVPGVAGLERHKSGLYHVHFGVCLPWDFQHKQWPEWSRKMAGSSNAVDWQPVPVDQMRYVLKYAIKDGTTYVLGWSFIASMRTRHRTYVNSVLFKTRGWYCVVEGDNVLTFAPVPAYCWER